jgi:hypothetical protein
MDSFSKKEISKIQVALNQAYHYNMFDHLMLLLDKSKYIYGIKLTKRGGTIKNFNRMEDERWTKIGRQKTAHFLPPKGLDAYIEIDTTLKYVDYQTKTKKVNIFNIIFHELFEAYMMVDVGLQYQEAHNYAGVQEKILLQQIPDMTEYAAAGGTLINAKYV